MPYHWSLIPQKLRHHVPLKCQENLTRQHIAILEYLDPEPWFLGHPPCNLAPVPIEPSECEMGRAVEENEKTAMWSGVNILSIPTYCTTDNKNSPNIKEWLMMPPKQYATRNIIGHD